MSNSALISAVRGPVMLITLGVLFQIDQSGGALFRKTWPVLLITYALFKLLEAVAQRRATAAAQDPLGGIR